MAEQSGDGDLKSKRDMRNLVVNRQYQLRYVVWLASAGLIIVLMNSTLFYCFTRENYSLLVDLSPMTDEAKAQLYHELWQIVFWLASANCIFMFVLTALGLFFSHRTAGPLYHFKRVFDDIGNGNRSARVHLRPTDDFQEVATSFNEMMDKLVKQR